MKHDATYASSPVRVSALVVALLAACVPVADGQSAIYGAGLQGWLGCWSAEPWTTRGEAAPPIVCIAPTADRNLADVRTVQEGRVVSRETLDASGRPRALGADRCEGTRSASWSRDGRRLFVRSSARCAGVPSTTSGILSITAAGDWLDVEGIAAGGSTSVRVARYHEVDAPAALPPTVRSALRAQALTTRSVRLASSAPVRAEDVLEASRAVDPTVLAAWLLERGQRVDVAPGEIAALLNAGLPSRVAEALEAVAAPQSYALVRGADERLGAVGPGMYDDSYGTPFGWGWGWGYYLPRSRNGRGHRDGWRYGHYRPPLVIVRGDLGRPRGREQGSGGLRPPSADPRRPAAGDPRRAEPQSGGTIRLGRPSG